MLVGQSRQGSNRFNHFFQPNLDRIRKKTSRKQFNDIHFFSPAQIGQSGFFKPQNIFLRSRDILVRTGKKNLVLHSNIVQRPY